MNLRSIDLNLLVVLDALLEFRHVGRAAERVGLSQPAASHSLARLRHLFNDRLLVRNGGRMELTAMARAVRGPLAHTLRGVCELFQPAVFDPATSQRQFRLMLPDLVSGFLLPSLIHKIAAAAPDVRVEIVAWQGATNITTSLAQSLDLIITYSEHHFAGFECAPLYLDRDVLVSAQGHVFDGVRPTFAQVLSQRHVAVIGNGERSDPVDDWLSDMGKARAVAAVVSSYLQALRVISDTKLVGIIPSRIASSLSGPLGLSLLKLPADPGIDRQMMFWPIGADTDPGSLWLRETIAQALNELPHCLPEG